MLPHSRRTPGSGYRVVYDRAGQRVWAVDENERIIRSWLVSGSTYGNELPGTHEVYSRSEMSTAWNGKAYLPNMIRWLKTERGAIGFHGIPTKVSTGEVYQTTDELGTRLSGGCQRQHNLDASCLWDSPRSVPRSSSPDALRSGPFRTGIPETAGNRPTCQLIFQRDSAPA